MLPMFPSIAAFVASIVGYQMPVVCQPLPSGTVVQAAITIDAPDYLHDSETAAWPPTSGAPPGVTFFLAVPPDGKVTVAIGGQTVALPPLPGDTPYTDENPTSGGITGWIYIPTFIVLDQSTCDDWTAGGATARGRAMFIAIVQAMQARWADGNEALTECRALQAFPRQLTSLFPTLTNPGNGPVGPGGPPAKPRLTGHSTAALTRFRQQLVRWRKADSTWRRASANWAKAYARWKALNDPWRAQLASESQMTAAAQAYDASQPPEYHGATC
jgi:hypothetical protein